MPVHSRALLAVLAVAAAVLLLPVVSAAGAGKNSTKIVISLKTPAFHGKLSSPRQACLGSRKVKMYRELNNTKKLLGKDTSEDNGKWAILLGKNLKAGLYYAIVEPRGKCKAAKSQLLPIA
jgi:hypothetical protein